jgi:hypothetical protein
MGADVNSLCKSQNHKFIGFGRSNKHAIHCNEKSSEVNQMIFGSIQNLEMDRRVLPAALVKGLEYHIHRPGCRY